MATTLLCSFPQRHYFKIRYKSYHAVSPHITSQPQSTRRAHLVISRVGHVVITQNTDLENVVRLASNGIPITESFVKIGPLVRKPK
jgi:hypothetical protein